MNSQALKKISFIGFILLTVSAIAAVFLSAKANTNRREAVYNGSLTDSDENWQNGIELTCSITWLITAPCEDTLTDGIYSGSTDSPVGTYSGDTTVFE